MMQLPTTLFQDFISSAWPTLVTAGTVIAWLVRLQAKVKTTEQTLIEVKKMIESTHAYCRKIEEKTSRLEIVSARGEEQSKYMMKRLDDIMKILK
jgi:alpha/beta superfamily hydrolase